MWSMSLFVNFDRDDLTYPQDRLCLLIGGKSVDILLGEFLQSNDCAFWKEFNRRDLPDVLYNWLDLRKHRVSLSTWVIMLCLPGY